MEILVRGKPEEIDAFISNVRHRERGGEEGKMFLDSSYSPHEPHIVLNIGSAWENEDVGKIIETLTDGVSGGRERRS